VSRLPPWLRDALGYCAAAALLFFILAIVLLARAMP